MQEQSIAQCLLFPELFGKPVVAQFDQPHSSSDGGALLVKAVDQQVGLTERLAACLDDPRQPGKVEHELPELVRQRVYGLTCGYADGNDAARLAGDPVHKLLVGRDPLEGPELASQPTLSRFENRVGPKDLYRWGRALAGAVLERHRQRLGDRARRLTLDLDVTDDATHGAQQLSFFNGHYDSHCYLPLLGFISFNDEPEQYLVAALLRPGNAAPQLGVRGLLGRLIEQLRAAFPKARLRVRLDGGFCHPELLDWLDAQPRLDYVIGLPCNAVLERRAARLMGRVRRRSQRTGQSAQAYGECRYRAQSWPRRRRVVLKAEVLCHPDRPAKDNPRFVVTNLAQRPRWIYRRIYCERGEIENRLKELHDAVALGRTSCPTCWANQFRLLLAAAAYVLLQQLRLQAAHTDCARAQAGTLRERLLKLGATVTRSVRRIVLHLPEGVPFLDTWQQVALAVGARAG
jgi:Transposase DDE domain group 1